MCQLLINLIEWMCLLTFFLNLFNYFSKYNFLKFHLFLNIIVFLSIFSQISKEINYIKLNLVYIPKKKKSKLMNDEKGRSILIYKCQNYLGKTFWVPRLITFFSTGFYFISSNWIIIKNQREVLCQLYCPFLCTVEYSECLDKDYIASGNCVLLFIFFGFSRDQLLGANFTVYNTIHKCYIHFIQKKLLKMILTVLFIYLKIILL